MATQGVEFANVSFTVEGGRQILTDISLRLEPGTTTALLGKSGSGKTTLLRMVNGLVKPTSGRVMVGGVDIASVDLLRLRWRIGYVIQNVGLFPHMTIAQNIRLPLDISLHFAGHFDEYEEAVRRVMDQVGMPYDDFGKRYPWQLSGGQQQRIGVARALVTTPGILLMDEPFGALDPQTRTEMQTMVRALMRPPERAPNTEPDFVFMNMRLNSLNPPAEMQAKVRELAHPKLTTLVVTHDLREALYLADRVVLVEAGRIVADVPVADVLGSGNPAMREYVAASGQQIPCGNDKQERQEQTQRQPQDQGQPQESASPGDVV